MLDITKKIAGLVGTPTYPESKFSGGEIAAKFSAFNDAGVECEVGEFLYALARLLKPQRILETGTHLGISAMYFAQAIADNGFGMVDTFEIIPEHHRAANARFANADLSQYINSHLGDVAKWSPAPDVQFKLMLLDTEPQLRFGELTRFFDYLSPRGIVLIHDLHPHMGQVDNSEHGFAWPWGKLPAMMVELVRGGALMPFHFDTPRGLTGFYKIAADDYDWGQK